MPYPLRSQHHEVSGWKHFEVAVEIERGANEVDDHPNAIWEEQVVRLEAEKRFETSRVIIRNPDSGRFVLNWIDNGYNMKTSAAINCNTTAMALRSAIKFCWNIDGLHTVNVHKKMYDELGE